MKVSNSAILAIFLTVGFPADADALYLDPVTGSMVLQIAVGGLLAMMATTKLYWRRIRSIFRKRED